MKYTIEGFDQQAALEARKDIKQEDGSIKAVKLDCVDLIILRWIVDYFPDMRKTTIDGEIYGWIRYDKVLEEFPLLDIKKRMLITRLSKMVELDILTHRTVKTNDGVFSYYGFGKEYAKLIRNAENDPCNKLQTPMQNIADPYAINCIPLCNKLHTPMQNIAYNNPSTNNPSTSNPSTSNERGKTQKRFVRPSVEDIEAYCRELQISINAEQFINHYDSNGWMVGKTAMKDWKATVRNWYIREHPGWKMPKKKHVETEAERQARLEEEKWKKWDEEHRVIV